MRVLLIDVSYLCYRAFHTTPDLSYKEIPTGVTYGFLRDVVSLAQDHETNRLVFCFDRGQSLRKAIYPKYKHKRHANKTDEEQAARRIMLQQIKLLRTDYLPRIGFRNIFSQLGYEADDMIASVCHNALGEDDEARIISADKDLYQLLSGQVSIWNPQRAKPYTLQAFHKDFGISPDLWPRVKAIAGCLTDDIDGVEGVGDKTAAKYLRSECKEESVAYKNIRAAREQTKFNMRLVKLPFKGTPPVTLVSDRFSIDGWMSVAEDLGMRSMRTADLAIFTGARRRGLKWK